MGGDEETQKFLFLAIGVLRRFHNLGFKITATKGTCIEFINNNIPSEFALKMTEGRPNIVDYIINGKINLIINTTVGRQSIRDSFPIRRNAIEQQIPYVTTIRGAEATIMAIEALKAQKVGVKPIQSYYR